jgi:glutathione S-transferase
MLMMPRQVNIDDFKTLKQWEDRMWARPAVKKGADVPDPYKMKETLANPAAIEKHAAEVSNLIQQQSR